MTNEDKIKEAKHILKMLEADKINHDEGNARIWCLVDSYHWAKYGDLEFVAFCEKPERFFDQDEYYHYLEKENPDTPPTGLLFKRYSYEKWWKPEGERGALVQVEDFLVIGKKYLTSLDACHSIMLEGWKFERLYSIGVCFACSLRRRFVLDGVKVDNSALSNPMKTMPLAWAHAILQSYIWEWKND